MCVLRDTYLIDDPAHYEPVEEPKKNIHLVKKTTVVVEQRRTGHRVFATTHFWCRTCKEKTPAEETKTCDCGMIMCNTCWEEWEVTCPLCDAAIG